MTIYVINSTSSFTPRHIRQLSTTGIDVIVPNIQHLSYLKYLYKQNDVTRASLLTIDDLLNNLLYKYNIRTSVCTKNDIQLFVNTSIYDLSKNNKAPVIQLTNKQNIINNIWNAQSLNISTVSKALLHAISKKMADHNIAFEQDIAKQILHQQNILNTFANNNNILFYGFVPFTRHLTTIQAASLEYTTADIVVHDYGDNDIFFSWLETLETIFGKIEFIESDRNIHAAESTEYCDIFDETKSVVFNIKTILEQTKNQSSIAIRIPSLTTPYLPILYNELENNNITYHSTFAEHHQCQPIIKLWIKWQKTRLITDYCKFCVETVSQNIIQSATCQEIFRQIKTLQIISLFRDYDRILELGNIKNLHAFNVLDEYDICYRSHTLSSFGNRFLNLFRKFLPKTISNLIQTKLCNDTSKETINCNTLLEYIENVIADYKQIKIRNDAANVVILDTQTVTDQQFSHTFILGQDNIYTSCNIELDTSIFQLIKDNNQEIENVQNLYTNKNNLIVQCLNKLSHQCRNLYISYHKQSYIDHTNEHSISQYVEYLTLDATKKTKTKDVFHKNNNKQHNEDLSTFRKSYTIRHDNSNLLNEYCFAIDTNKTTPTACKSIEYLFKNPHVGFYTSVLGLQPMPWTKDNINKKITIGSLVHNFLQIPNAQNTCTKRLSYATFSSNIHQRAQQLSAQIDQACSSCDMPIPHSISDAIQRSSIIAHKLLLRLLSYDNWQYFLSEYKLPKTSYITIESTKLYVSGIIDFIATNCCELNTITDSNSAIIIDFKTGNDIELTARNVATLIKKYNSLQLVLYGMALRTTGMKNISLLLLRQDSPDKLQPIYLEYVLQNSKNTMQLIENILTNGIIPKQIFGKQFRQYVIKDVPLATTDLY